MYDKLIGLAPIERNCEGLGMIGFHNPVSITESEFKYLTDYITGFNLKSGFEVATAFGVSACAAGLGFQKTGGTLTTMDCYIEEHTKNCAAYNLSDSTNFKNERPYGLMICHKLLAGLDIKCVKTLIGVSPQDIPAGQYDYVFIDAEHTNEAIRRDLLGIKPFLAGKFTVFIHDIHCFGGLEEFVQEHFECKIERNVAPAPNYGLSYFRNF